jgi:hypothetical protein
MLSRLQGIGDLKERKKVENASTACHPVIHAMLGVPKTGQTPLTDNKFDRPSRRSDGTKKRRKNPRRNGVTISRSMVAHTQPTQ